MIPEVFPSMSWGVSQRAAIVCCTLLAQLANAQTLAPEPQAQPQISPEPTESPLRAPSGEPPSRVAGSQQGANALQSGPRKFGSFLLYPQLEIGAAYDDNVFYSSSNEARDWFLTVSPMLWMQSQWGRHAVNAYASADFTRYRDFSSEDTNDYRAGIEGRHDLTDQSNLYGGLYAAREHEDRESPDDLNGITPTDYRQYRYYAGFFRQFDSLSFRAAGTAMYLDFDDVDFRNNSGVINVINNDDRDRWQYTGGLRLGYLLSPAREAYLQLALDNRRYRASVDDLGVARDSDGLRALVGLRWIFPERMKLDAYVGYMRQDYEDDRSPTISQPAFGLAISSQTPDQRRLFLIVDRTIEETTVTQTVGPDVVLYAPGYINTYVTAGLQQPIMQRLTFKLSGTLSRADYEGLNRRDDYKSISAGLSYRTSPNLILALDLTHRRLSSSVTTEEFRKNLAMLKLIFPF